MHALSNLEADALLGKWSVFKLRTIVAATGRQLPRDKGEWRHLLPGVTAGLRPDKSPTAHLSHNLGMPFSRICIYRHSERDVRELVTVTTGECRQSFCKFHQMLEPLHVQGGVKVAGSLSGRSHSSPDITAWLGGSSAMNV